MELRRPGRVCEGWVGGKQTPTWPEEVGLLQGRLVKQKINNNNNNSDNVNNNNVNQLGFVFLGVHLNC